LKSKSYEQDLQVLDELDQKVEHANKEIRQLQDSFKKRRQNPVVKTVIDLVSSAVHPTVSTPSISSKVSSSMSASITSVYEDCSDGDGNAE
jgi:hypothetical protein